MTRIVSIAGITTDWAIDNQTADYQAWIDAPFSQPSTTTAVTPRESNWPIGVKVTQDARQLPPIYIRITDTANEAALRSALLAALDTSTQFKALVLSDDNDANPRYIMCSFQGKEEFDEARGSGRLFVVTAIATGDPYLRAVTPTSHDWTVTASGQTTTVTNTGDMDAYPVITVTPTAANGVENWVGALPFYVLWRSPRGSAMHSFLVTPSGLDTAALKTAGDVTDSTNMAAFVNGEFVPMWFANVDGVSDGFDSVDSKIWINYPIKAKIVVTLKSAVSSASTQTTWQVETPPGMPRAGYIYWEDTGEIIAYNGLGVLGSPEIRNVIREQLDSSAGNHAVDATGEVLQLVGHILWGPSGAIPEDAPKVSWWNLHGKPMVANGTSTNSQWLYTSFVGGGQVTPTEYNRTQRWNLNAPVGVYNTATDATGIAGEFNHMNEWTGMGFRANHSNDASRPGAPNMTKPGGMVGIMPVQPRVEIAFWKDFAMPIGYVIANGRRIGSGSQLKYRGAPILAVADSNGLYQTRLWVASEPDTNGATLSRTSNTTFYTYAPISLSTDRTDLTRVKWLTYGDSWVQADISDLLIAFSDDYAPIVANLTPVAYYDMNMVIANETTGESLTISMPDIALNEDLVIDCEANTAVYEYDNTNRYAAVARDTRRARMMRLAPGGNTLRATDAGIGDVDINLSFETRHYT